MIDFLLLETNKAFTSRPFARKKSRASSGHFKGTKSRVNLMGLNVAVESDDEAQEANEVVEWDDEAQDEADEAVESNLVWS